MLFRRLPKNAPDGCTDQEDASGPNRSISAVTLGKDRRMHHQNCELNDQDQDQTKSPMHGPITDDLAIEDLEWLNEGDNVKKRYASDDCNYRDQNGIITLKEGMESVTSSVVDFDELSCLRGTGVFTPVSRSRTDLFRDDEHLGKPDKSILI